MSGSEGEGNLTSFQLALLVVAFGLFLGSLTRFIQQNFIKVPIPYTVVLLILGLILGVIEERLGKLGPAVHSVKSIDPHLLLGAFIPSLIFESAFSVNYHTISREFVQALLLAGPGVLINTSLTAVFVKYCFPYNWSWSQSTLFGAIVSATDPVAVVALLRDLGASKRLATLIEAESLLNDGTAFVLYMIALKFVIGENPGIDGVILSFLQLALVGAAVGLLFGFAMAAWLKLVFNDSQVEITITVFSCYLCFYIAEIEFHASGVLACVFLGLVLSKYKLAISPSIEESLHHVWEILGYIATTLIFVFGGIIIVDGVINERQINLNDTLYLIIIYIFIHITRAISLMILWFPLAKTGYGITFKDTIILSVGGLRGVIGLALGLLTQLEDLRGATQNEENEFKYQIMFHTSGIVFLTLIINAVAMKHIVQYLGMDKPSKEAEIILKDAMEHLRQSTKQKIEHLKSDYNYSGADWAKVVTSLPSYAKVFKITEDKPNNKESNNRTSRTRPKTWDEFRTMATVFTMNTITASIMYGTQCCKCCKKARSPYDSDNSRFEDSTNDGGIRIGIRSIKFSGDSEEVEIRKSNVRALKHFHRANKLQSERFGVKMASFKRLFNRSMMEEDTTDTVTKEEENEHGMKLELEELKEDKEELRFASASEIVSASDSERPIIGATMSGMTKKASLLPSLQTVLAIQNVQNELKLERNTMNEKRKQFQHRILNVMKSCYLTAYEEGTISQTAETALVNAVEYALDYDDIQLQYEYLMQYFKISKFLQKWYGSGKLQKLSRYILFNKLSVAVEVGTVFIASFKQVKVVLTDVPEISASPLCRDVVQILQKHSDDIREEWNGIQQSYPEVYKAIQTRHAVQHIIHSESNDIKDLKLHGLLDDTEYQRMMNQLNEAQHKLSFTLFHNITISSDDKKNVLLHLAFCNKISPKKYHLKMAYLLDHSELLLKNRKELLYKAGENAKGIFVLVRGTVVIKIDNEVKDRYTSGSVLAWEYLVHTNYVCDCEAQTSVEYYFVPDQVVEYVLNEEREAQISLWRTCAINVILAFFRGSFSEYTRVNVSSMVLMSILHEAKIEEIRTITKRTLLLKGKAAPALGSPDEDTYNAPALLLANNMTYRFTAGSILLTFEFTHLIKTTKFKPLQRNINENKDDEDIITITPRRKRRTQSLLIERSKSGSHSHDLSVHSEQTRHQTRARSSSMLPSLHSMKQTRSSDSVLRAVDETIDLDPVDIESRNNSSNEVRSPSFATPRLSPTSLL